MSKKDDKKDGQENAQKAAGDVIRIAYLKKDGRGFWRGGVEHQGVKYYDPAFFTRAQLSAIRAEGERRQFLEVEDVPREEAEKAGLPVIGPETPDGE